MTWLSKSADYLALTGSSTSSPSRSVADALRSTVEPLPPESPDPHNGHSPAYFHKAEGFIEATLARAGATAAAWTGEALTATTSPDGPRGSLFVSPAGILARGADPDHAADYATGRLLVAASQREYLSAAEVGVCREAVHEYHYAASSKRPGRIEAAAPQYAACHLASTVATVRGRERVLKAWPGWAGYFAAAEGERTTAAEAAAFIATGKAPAIVRAAYALGREAEGHALPADLPADIAAMLDLGRPHLASAWAKNRFHERARAAIDAMNPPPATRQDEEEKGYENSDSGEESDGEEAETPSGADPIPGSAAEDMTPSNADSDLPRVEATTDPERGDKPGGGKATKSGADARKYPVIVRPIEYTSGLRLDQLREDSRGLVNALSRIRWESMEPPTVDHGQDSGEIDEAALASLAAWNEPRVFQRRQERGAVPVAVHILIDCSGSMGAGTRHGSHRLRDAKAVAYAMATAFKGSRFNVTVGGHHVSYSMSKYPTGAIDYTTCATPEDIAAINTGGDNADGWAIAHALDRVAAMPAARRAVFLLADGQPSACGYGGHGARAHVRAVVESARGRGIDFLAIGIERAMRDTGPGLFGSRFISLDDTRSAGPLLARVIGRIGKEAMPCE